MFQALDLEPIRNYVRNGASLSGEEISAASLILNLGRSSPPGRGADRHERLDEITRAWREQEKALLLLQASFLAHMDGKANLKAYHYIVENLSAIRSIFMLDGLAELFLEADAPPPEDEELPEDYGLPQVYVLRFAEHEMMLACSNDRVDKLSDPDLERALFILNETDISPAPALGDRSRRIGKVWRATVDQNRTMLQIGRRFVQLEFTKPGLDAYVYALENLGAIRSIWMLNQFAGLFV